MKPTFYIKHMKRWNICIVACLTNLCLHSKVWITLSMDISTSVSIRIQCLVNKSFQKLPVGLWTLDDTWKGILLFRCYFVGSHGLLLWLEMWSKSDTFNFIVHSLIMCDFEGINFWFSVLSNLLFIHVLFCFEHTWNKFDAPGGIFVTIHIRNFFTILFYFPSPFLGFSKCSPPPFKKTEGVSSLMGGGEIFTSGGTPLLQGGWGGADLFRPHPLSLLVFSYASNLTFLDQNLPHLQNFRLRHVKKVNF